MKLSSENKGCAWSGSSTKTSEAAPAINLFDNALYKSLSLIIPPRDKFNINAVFSLLKVCLH